MRGKEGVASGWGLTLTDYLGRQQLYFVDVPASLMTIRVSHLQFFFDIFVVSGRDLCASH